MCSNCCTTTEYSKMKLGEKLRFSFLHYYSIYTTSLKFQNVCSSNFSHKCRVPKLITASFTSTCALTAALRQSTHRWCLLRNYDFYFYSTIYTTSLKFQNVCTSNFSHKCRVPKLITASFTSTCALTAALRQSIHRWSLVRNYDFYFYTTIYTTSLKFQTAAATFHTSAVYPN